MTRRTRAFQAAWIAPLVLGAAAALPASATEPDDLCAVHCFGDAPDAACHIYMLDGGEFSPMKGGPGGFALGTTRDKLEMAGDLGVRVVDDLALQTPFGELVLAESDITMTHSKPEHANCNTGFDTLVGHARMPVPAVGELAELGVDVVSQPVAQIGMTVGAALMPQHEDDPCLFDGTCLDVPIPRPERHYLFFDMTAGYEFAIGLLDIKSPGVGGTLLFDPQDPYFYIDVEGFALPPKGLTFSSGLGFSLNSEIPFEPVSTWGMEEHIKPFGGTLQLRDFFSIEKLPVVVNGTRVYSLDPDGDGDHPLFSPLAWERDPDLEYGANGDISVVWYPFSKKGSRKKAPSQKKVEKNGKKGKDDSSYKNKLIRVKFDLGRASAGVRIEPLEGHPGVPVPRAYISGELEPNQDEIVPSFLPLPIEAAGSVKAAALFSSNNLSESFVRMEGGFVLDTGNLAKAVGLKELGSVTTADALLSIDQHGYLLRGTTTSQVHPSIRPEESASLEGFLAPNGIDSHVALSGDVSLGSVYLHDAAVVLSPKKLAARGIWQTENEAYVLTGEAGPAGVKLTGKTTIEMDYTHENVKKKARLLAKWTDLDLVVIEKRDALAAAKAAVRPFEEDAKRTGANLAAARAEVESLNDGIRAIEAHIDSLEGQLAAQKRRSCSLSYSGCKSCSGCGSCGKYDAVCHAKKKICEAKWLTCQADRNACALKNKTACETDKNARIVALAGEIGLWETERGLRIAARDTALAGLAPLIAANDTAQAVWATMRETVEAAQIALVAAERARDAIEEKIHLLPKIEGTVTTKLKLVLTEKGLVGKVKADFNGRKITDGWVDTEVEPPVACLVLPFPDGEETHCTAL